jgi:ADP-ribose pyrophosphatase YjhB (NUDIX family)
MIEITKADAYGVVLVNAKGEVLLREPKGHFGGYVWTFAKGRPSKGETPDATAKRKAFDETGYSVELLDAIPDVFSGTTTSSSFFLAGPLGKQSKPAEETEATRWVDFDEAARLIGQTKSKTGRERDLAILRSAKDIQVRLDWARRPATCKEDWETKRLPNNRAEFTLDLQYDDAAMARIRKGFLPTVMEEKWFIWFDEPVLHFHRSWTGNCIFQVRFVHDSDGWHAVYAKVNRKPDQYSETDDVENRRLVADLINGWLINGPDGPAADPIASTQERADRNSTSISSGLRSDLAAVSRRYGSLEEPYYGFEGSFQAQKDGKLWLNNINLLFPMLADFLVQEIRYYAFQIANQYDHNASTWPKIVEAEATPSWQKRWARLAQFLTIFSGRDKRFAYDDNFLPGGGLEGRLLKEFGSEDYDPRDDAQATHWHYPIDAKDPLAAPANMRLLNIRFYSWDADYYGMAASALCGELGQVLSGNPITLIDPTDDTPYTYGKIYKDDGTLAVRFHAMLCEWVEVFAGLESLNLAENTEPMMSDAQLYFAILSLYPDELAEGNVTVLEAPVAERWRSLEEIQVD